MTTRIRRLHMKLLSGVAALAISTTAALADGALLSLPEQPLAQSLKDIARATGVNILFTPDAVADIKARALKGQMTARIAVNALLAGSNLEVVTDASGGLIVRRLIAEKNVPAPMPQAAESSGAASTEETSEKRSDTQTDRSAAVEKVIVTGSRIRGNKSAGPLITITRTEIERSGSGTVSDVLRTLPQNSAAGPNEGTFSGTLGGRGITNAGRGSSFNLRGIGSGATLTLINGRRLAPAEAGDFADVSAVPLAAVDRIEILTDGASAIYGSDAISGVVNIILRKDFDGAETSVRYGEVSDGGYSQFSASQTFGHYWGSGRSLLSYQYTNNGALYTQERDLTDSLRSGVKVFSPTETHALYLDVEQRLGDRLTLFGNLLFNDRIVDDSGPKTTDARFFNTEGRVVQLNGTAGIEVDLFADWQVEASTTYSKNDVTSRFTTPTLSRYTANAEVRSVDIKADGSVLAIPGGDVRAAVGASHLNYEILTRDQASGFLLARGQRHATAAFAELFVPLVGSENAVPGVNQFEVTLAGRVDEYSDFGQTTNPKLSALWSPVEGLALRGSWGTSFRAPQFKELTTSNRVALLWLTDPLSTNPNGLSVVLLLLGHDDLQPETSETWTAGFDFAPSSWSGFRASVNYYSLDFQDRIALPSSNAATALLRPDVFGSILARNPTPADIAAALATTAQPILNLTAFNPAGPRTPADANVIENLRIQNLSRSLAEGLDIRLDYDRDTSFGSVGIGVNANYIINQQNFLTDTSPPDNAVDATSYPPSLVARGELRWSDGPYAGSLFANFHSAYNDTFSVPRGFGPHEVEAGTVYDLSLSFSGSETEDGHLLNGTRVTLSIINLFDELGPRVTPSQVATLEPEYDPANSDIRGRFISLKLTQLW